MEILVLFFHQESIVAEQEVTILKLKQAVFTCIYLFHSWKCSMLYGILAT